MAIDVVLVSNFSGPTSNDIVDVSDDGKIDWSGFQMPSLIWSNDNIIYEARPYYFELDLQTGLYSTDSFLFRQLGSEYRFMSPCNGGDFICFEYGNYGPLSERRFGLYSSRDGWKDIDDKLEKRIIRNQKSGTSDKQNKIITNNWEIPLLGLFSLVNSPNIDDVEELQLMDMQSIVSVKNLQTESITKNPKELYSVRNVGDTTKVAVSFDRFRIAMIGEVIQETEDDPLRLDNRVYILKVVYDGETVKDVQVYTEVDEINDTSDFLPIHTSVLVTDADHYEIREDGTEDFWYKIESGDTCGWVFGGDLLIEGYDWKNRLETRGRLIEWEQVDSLIESYRSDSSKGQTDVVHTSDTVGKTSTSTEIEEEIGENTKKWMMYMLILGFSVFALLFLVVRMRILKKPHSI